MNNIIDGLDETQELMEETILSKIVSLKQGNIMAATLLPLHVVNIAGVTAYIKANTKIVDTFGKIADAVSSIPGVGNIKGMIKEMLVEKQMLL